MLFAQGGGRRVRGGDIQFVVRRAVFPASPLRHALFVFGGSRDIGASRSGRDPLDSLLGLSFGFKKVSCGGRGEGKERHLHGRGKGAVCWTRPSDR